MARRYAGILGLAAFAATVLRGAVHNSPAEQVFLHAAICLFMFAAAGYVIGAIAAATVSHAVRVRFVAEMRSASGGGAEESDK